MGLGSGGIVKMELHRYFVLLGINCIVLYICKSSYILDESRLHVRHIPLRLLNACRNLIPV
jgi:hypothetical protein